MERTNSTPCGLFFLALACFLTSAEVVSAGEDSPEVREKNARANYRQGLELYEAGQFDLAAIAFERAYEIRPSFKILWNLAQVENELGHYAAAYVAYTRYLAEGAHEVPTDRRAEVLTELERLSTLVGTLRVEFPLPGAAVFADGKKLGVTPLSDAVFLDIGEHVVSIQLGAEEIHQEIIRIAGGRQVTVSVATPNDEPSRDEPTPSNSPPPGQRRWTWVALGVGGAAGLAGGILGGIALSRKTDIETHCRDQHCPAQYEDEAVQVESLALTADILYGVAAAGVIAAVVLYFVERKLGTEPELLVSPVVSADTAGLAMVGRF